MVFIPKPKQSISTMLWLHRNRKFNQNKPLVLMSLWFCKGLGWGLGVFKEFPRCPPVNLNPRTVSNHIDAVIMCSDWDPDPLNILESERFTFFALNYIIAISKLDAVWLPHSWGRRLFSGGKFTEVWGADLRGDLYQHKHLSELKCFAGDRSCYSSRNVTQNRWDRQ